MLFENIVCNNSEHEIAACKFIDLINYAYFNYLNLSLCTISLLQHLLHSMDLGNEHYRAYIYIEWKRGITATDVHHQLQETGLKVPCQTTVFQWYKRFKEDRDSLEHDERVGRPCSSSTAPNAAIIRELLDQEPRQSIRTLAESTGLTKDVVHNILHTQLGLRKV